MISVLILVVALCFITKVDYSPIALVDQAFQAECENGTNDEFQLPRQADMSESARRANCKITCRLEIVESIPVNISFGATPLPTSTFDAWSRLIDSAEHEIEIAAYKSSLRGKHVLGDSNLLSYPGDEIFQRLHTAGTNRSVQIKMVENFPPKDPGDNMDGSSLQRRGAIERRSLHYSRLFGTGTMHSKFLVADEKHLYIGSANLDWRSLNQKMELGIMVTDCGCLARDLKRIFHTYWQLTSIDELTTDEQQPIAAVIDNVASKLHAQTVYNEQHPLELLYHGAVTDVYLASSPQELNGPGRSWDLNAILTAIDSAQQYIYIHVMDYIPMIIYSQPTRYWGVIDNALRVAVVERGVEVKLLTAALHHVPKTLRFLKSLAAIDGTSARGSLSVKIFKVPTMSEHGDSVLMRERRTHNKFIVTEQRAIIGTSNWSGDYFLGNTGVALVVTQNRSMERPFIDQMHEIFVRDWQSPYAHRLHTYMHICLNSKQHNDTLCEVDKDLIKHYQHVHHHE